MAEKAGLSPEKLGAAIQLVEREASSGAVGAVAFLVARDSYVAVERGYGRLFPGPGSPPCRPDSVFLVASITKPMTTMAVMKLVERGRIGLDDPVSRYLPEFSGQGRERITVRHLLTHTTGLPDMLPENIELRKRQAPLREFVAGTLRAPLLFPPGTRVSYQSMGILLAAEIVEHLAGERLNSFLEREVFTPLGMRSSSLGLRGRQIEETVQCGLPSSSDLTMTAADKSWNWNSPYWRNLGAPWGGMHSTAGDIALALQAMLEGGRPVLQPDTARAMITDQNAGLDKPWGLGWQLGTGAFFPSSPAALFGHSGSTGTMCWADPARKLIFVLLTNRPLANDPSNLHARVSALVSEAASS
ncbi:MAG: beta-lactamase family protein [Acidobacteria bacterium]|nr:beta-lactamase family protein [Acidobacteriota bacterium]